MQVELLELRHPMALKTLVVDPQVLQVERVAQLLELEPQRRPDCLQLMVVSEATEL